MSNRNENLEEQENELKTRIEDELKDLEFLEKERLNIGNPETITNSIMNVVWDEFINTVAITAGEDFIKENNGLTLDLRNSAHIQTTENFKDGKIATHNTEIDYQERLDTGQDSFEKNADGTVKTKVDSRSGEEREVLKKEARADFDKDRPKGSTSSGTDMDHTISAGEMLRDPDANAHLDRSEIIDYANSDKNLNEMDSSANRSKGDSSMDEWLESTREVRTEEGTVEQTPEERFDIDGDELRQKDEEAREGYEKLKEEGKQRSIETGKKSQKEEFFRIGGKALRSAVMTIVLSFVKEIVQKLIAWISSAKKSVETLIESVKKAIESFMARLKNELINAGMSASITVIASTVTRPVVSMITKAIAFLKQGYRSLKEAIEYLKNPANANEPYDIKLLNVGKIVIAGVTAGSTLILSEVIEKGLMVVPVMAFDIPLFGSLANIIGLLLAGITSGIIGAIALNYIDNLIADKQISEVNGAIFDKNNAVLVKQYQLIDVNGQILEDTKADVLSSIFNRHNQANNTINNALDNIYDDSEIITEDDETTQKFKNMNKKFDDLFGDD